jgi:hypothetical protein
MNVKSLTAALAACLMVAGCADDGKKTYGDTYSLTVFAYDAVTGAPIPSAALAAGLVIYEGADKVQPVVLDTTLAGAAIFEDVPADYFGGNKIFPIMASIAGYEPFQGTVTFKAANPGYSDTYYLNDDLFAQVGNIYLFPVGSHAPDYTFTVMYDGKPVSGAVVQFDPTIVGSAATMIDTDGSGIITPVAGHIPALPAATTDANGKVTFAGSALALGVTYKATVFPVVVGGVQLGQQSFNVSIGLAGNNVDRIITLVPLVPNANHGLYVTNISNFAKNPVASGTLTITFNTAVVLHSTWPDVFNFSSDSATGVERANPAVSTDPLSVNASLSADGKTLTLTPNWTTVPTFTNEYGSSVLYTNGSAFVTLPGAADVAIPVFGLTLADNATLISGQVFLTPAGP